MKKRCDTCKWFGTGCFDKECNYPELESWEPKYPENLDRQKDEEERRREEKLQRDINTVRNVCSKCKHRDEKYSNAPCSECFEIETHPKFEAVKVEEMKLCCNCKYGIVGFESYPCGLCFEFPGHPMWEKDDGIRTCAECTHRDLYFDEPPCDKCYGKTGHPKFKQRIEVKLEGVEEVKQRLKRIIEKDQFLVGIVHPSYMEMHDPKIYYFSSDFCLEEGTEVLVEEDDGTRAWGRVFVPSVPFENEQIEFIRDMGEEIGRVVGIFTPFHKCEE